MKLKCIGGEWDGKYFDIDAHYKVGDWVRLPETYKSVEHDFNPNDYELKGIVRDYVQYRVTAFHFSKDDQYKFLVTHYPVQWSDKQALLHQFTK